MSLNWKEARDLVADLREQAASSDEIRATLRQAGCSKIKIAKLVPTRRGCVSPTAAFMGVLLVLAPLSLLNLFWTMVEHISMPNWLFLALIAGIPFLAAVLSAGLIARGGKFATVGAFFVVGAAIAAMLFAGPPVNEYFERMLEPRIAEMRCLGNVKQLTLALLSYSEDHGGALPAAIGWREEVAPYIGEDADYLPKCPVTGEAYTYNSGLSGKSVKEFANRADVPLVWEEQSGNKQAPHDSGFSVGFLDGHAEQLDEAEFIQLMDGWQP